MGYTQWSTTGPLPHPSHHRFLPQFRVQLGHLVLVDLVEFGVDPLFGINNVLLEQFLRDRLDTSPRGHAL